MRFHVVSLAHTETTKNFSWCAYTEKCRRFSNMMHDLGHEVYLYAGEGNEARCTEHICCITREAQSRLYKKPLIWDENDPLWSVFADAAINEIRERIQPDDFICLISGTQRPIMAAFPDNMTVEFGVGYRGVVAPHAVYESYAWMHTVYGSFAGVNAMSYPGKNFDTVIPNYYEPEDFPLGDGKGGYLLYMGRLIPMKGIDTVSAIQKATGLPLIVAGEGDYHPDVPHQYRGLVGSKERAELMGGALATLYPTQYLEPFGGVAIESMMCGTPSITTDWGAFTENIPRDFRCRTLQDFVDAVDMASRADRTALRNHAIRYFSVDAIAPQYEAYFQRLVTLRGEGWYQLREEPQLVAI